MRTQRGCAHLRPMTTLWEPERIQGKCTHVRGAPGAETLCAFVVAREDTKQETVSVINSGTARARVLHGEEEEDISGKTTRAACVRRRMTTLSPSRLRPAIVSQGAVSPGRGRWWTPVRRRILSPTWPSSRASTIQSGLRRTAWSWPMAQGGRGSRSAEEKRRCV